jgi:WD40 repeat protein
MRSLLSPAPLFLSAQLILAGAPAHAQVPPTQVYPMIETGQHSAKINRLGVDPAGRWLVTGSYDRTARVWNLTTGALVRVLRPPVGKGHVGQIYTVALSPDGSRVAVGGYTGEHGPPDPVYLFDRASGRLMHSHGLADVAHVLAFSPDGTRLAVGLGGGHGLHILDGRDLGVERAADPECRNDIHGLDFDRSGRLVSTCGDGVVRLYDAAGVCVARLPVDGSLGPHGVRFSPDGRRIALGFDDSTAVMVISGQDLTPLYRADTRFAQDGNLAGVAWSQDGTRLYAAGTFRSGELSPVVMWTQAGRSAPVLWGAAPSAIDDLVALAGGRLLFGSMDPDWGVLGPAGGREGGVLPDVLDFSDPEDGGSLRLSPDGTKVEFGFHIWDGRERTHSVARVDLDSRILGNARSDAAGLQPPRTTGLPVTDWRASKTPKLHGLPLKVLSTHERSQALSIAAGNGGFVLGMDWSVRSLSATGRQLWSRAVAGTAWAVNQSADGRFVVAALGDGTIRWYQAGTGRELLALFVDAHDRRVLFTPEGFFAASPGAAALLGYQINQGPDHEGLFVEAAQLGSLFNRPELIATRLAGDETPILAAQAGLGDVRQVLAGGPPPQVTLLSAPVAASADGAYALRVQVTPGRAGARVGALTVAVNGRELAVHTPCPPAGGVVTRQLLLPPGVNTVSVRALRADGGLASFEAVAQVTVPARR